MNRKEFLEAACGIGVCGCIASVIDPADAIAAAQSDSDQKLAFAHYQLANLVRSMAAGPAVSECTQILEQTGRKCAALGGVGVKFKGDPEGYFAAARKTWGTEFEWDKAKGIVTVAVAEGPCGCPLVDPSQTPAFWCNCSVGYQKEAFSGVFGRPVRATLKESKLAGARRCVFEVEVGPAA